MLLQKDITEMLINREITDIILLYWWNSSCFHCRVACAFTIGDDDVILAFSFTFDMFEGSPWKGKGEKHTMSLSSTATTDSLVVS
ncbi:hypothetical protein SLA2020_136660 [Shorea laevis]